MKLNAIVMVKNEVDVVFEAIANALRFCHKIYVFDNGSTDGTWEGLEALAKTNPRVEIAYHSSETFKNQLRNRVYNKYHHLYSKEDWWYILDADELLVSDPREMLFQAAAASKDCMRVWQAQFYFTDKDLAHYRHENTLKPVTQRRKYYRINWREERFFKNDPEQKWSEAISGRIPPFCGKFYRKSPICRHYAERTPEQIEVRTQVRINNPFSFFHMKNRPQNAWLKKSEELFYYQNDGQFKFPIKDQINYFSRELGYWLQWRFKNVRNLLARLGGAKAAC